jgi:hypothetical protein
MTKEFLKAAAAATAHLKGFPKVLDTLRRNYSKLSTIIFLGSN